MQCSFVDNARSATRFDVPLHEWQDRIGGKRAMTQPRDYGRTKPPLRPMKFAKECLSVVVARVRGEVERFLQEWKVAIMEIIVLYERLDELGLSNEEQYTENPDAILCNVFRSDPGLTGPRTDFKDRMQDVVQVGIISAPEVVLQGIDGYNARFDLVVFGDVIHGLAKMVDQPVEFLKQRVMTGLSSRSKRCHDG